MISVVILLPGAKFSNAQKVQEQGGLPYSKTFNGKRFHLQ